MVRPAVGAARLSQPFAAASRSFATEKTLKERFAELYPLKAAEIKEIKAKHGDMVLGNCTIEQAYGGMRSVKCMVYETSVLDSEEGIRFRGLSIPECQAQLPKAPGGEEPLPEAIFWLMVTGEVPTEAQVRGLTKEFHARSEVPKATEDLILSLPKGMHPMTQLSIGIMSLQQGSKFAAAYQAGVHKSTYWDPVFEDTLDLVAKLPRVAALIYRHTYFDDKLIPADHSLDWSANYSKMMGFSDPKFDELMRLYLTIHSDHEGGNVSAHTTHLVGSTLSDPYLSLAAGMNGLAGPLHGLANQEVLRWLRGFKEKLGGQAVTKDAVTKALWDTLNAGQVVPGYGHAVLRKPDPRYMCQREFALKHLKDDELFHLVSTIFEVAPGVLTEHGKTKNPFPNVDAHSGVLLMHYGCTQEDYYTVMFGVSRALGVLAQLLWSRAVGFPLERPKSMSTEGIKKFIAANSK